MSDSIFTDQIPELSEAQQKLLEKRDAYLDTTDFSFLDESVYPMEAAQYYCLKNKRLVLFGMNKLPWKRIVFAKKYKRYLRNDWLRNLQPESIQRGFEGAALFSSRDFSEIAGLYRDDFDSFRSRIPEVILLMGAANRLLCIDCDGETGVENFHTLWEAYTGEKEPHTAAEITPSGGRHYLFRISKDCALTNAKKGMPPCVDVRGNGGYIIVSPSRRSIEDTFRFYTPVTNKEIVYEEQKVLTQHSLMDLPYWLQNLLEEHNGKKSFTGIGEGNRPLINYKMPTDYTIPEWTGESTPYGKAVLKNSLKQLAEAVVGNRNNTLFKCTANIFNYVAGESIQEPEYEILQELRIIAVSIGLEHKEIEATLQSGYLIGMNNPRYPKKSSYDPSFYLDGGLSTDGWTKEDFYTNEFNEYCKEETKEIEEIEETESNRSYLIKNFNPSGETIKSEKEALSLFDEKEVTELSKTEERILIEENKSSDLELIAKEIKGKLQSEVPSEKSQDEVSLEKRGDLPDFGTATEVPDKGKAQNTSTQEDGVDIFSEEDIKNGIPSIPLHIFPESIRNVIHHSARVYQTDYTIPFYGVILSLSTLIGRSAVIDFGGYENSAHMWMSLICESGSNKSQITKKLFEGIDFAQMRELEQHNDDLDIYDEALAEYQRAMKEKKGEGELPEKPIKPKCTRFYMHDTTPEAMIPVLMDNPEGFMWIYDELASLFGSMKRYQNSPGASDGFKNQLLTSYDAGHMQISRVKGGGRTAVLPHASIGMGGTLQPGRLKNTFTVEDRMSGFLGRFIFAYSDPPPPVLEPDKLNMVHFNKWKNNIVETLLDWRNGRNPETRSTPEVVTLSPKAEKYVQKFFYQFISAAYRKHNENSEGIDGQIKTIANRWRGHFSRLLLLLHFMYLAENKFSTDLHIVEDFIVDNAVELSMVLMRHNNIVWRKICQTGTKDESGTISFNNAQMLLALEPLMTEVEDGYTICLGDKVVNTETNETKNKFHAFLESMSLSNAPMSSIFTLCDMKKKLLEFGFTGEKKVRNGKLYHLTKYNYKNIFSQTKTTINIETSSFKDTAYDEMIKKLGGKLCQNKNSYQEPMQESIISENKPAPIFRDALEKEENNQDEKISIVEDGKETINEKNIIEKNTEEETIKLETPLGSENKPAFPITEEESQSDSEEILEGTPPPLRNDEEDDDPDDDPDGGGPNGGGGLPVDSDSRNTSTAIQSATQHTDSAALLFPDPDCNNSTLLHVFDIDEDNSQLLETKDEDQNLIGKESVSSLEIKENSTIIDAGKDDSIVENDLKENNDNFDDENEKTKEVEENKETEKTSLLSENEQEEQETSLPEKIKGNTPCILSKDFPFQWNMPYSIEKTLGTFIIPDRVRIVVQQKIRESLFKSIFNKEDKNEAYQKSFKIAEKLLKHVPSWHFVRQFIEWFPLKSLQKEALYWEGRFTLDLPLDAAGYHAAWTPEMKAFNEDLLQLSPFERNRELAIFQSQTVSDKELSFIPVAKNEHLLFLGNEFFKGIDWCLPDSDKKSYVLASLLEQGKNNGSPFEASCILDGTLCLKTQLPKREPLIPLWAYHMSESVADQNFIDFIQNVQTIFQEETEELFRESPMDEQATSYPVFIEKIRRCGGILPWKKHADMILAAKKIGEQGTCEKAIWTGISLTQRKNHTIVPKGIVFPVQKTIFHTKKTEKEKETLFQKEHVWFTTWEGIPSTPELQYLIARALSMRVLKNNDQQVIRMAPEKNILQYWSTLEENHQQKLIHLSEKAPFTEEEHAFVAAWTINRMETVFQKENPIQQSRNALRHVFASENFKNGEEEHFLWQQRNCKIEHSIISHIMEETDILQKGAPKPRYIRNYQPPLRQSVRFKAYMKAQLENRIATNPEAFKDSPQEILEKQCDYIPVRNALQRFFAQERGLFDEIMRQNETPIESRREANALMGILPGNNNRYLDWSDSEEVILENNLERLEKILEDDNENMPTLIQIEVRKPPEKELTEDYKKNNQETAEDLKKSVEKKQTR